MADLPHYNTFQAELLRLLKENGGMVVVEETPLRRLGDVLFEKYGQRLGKDADSVQKMLALLEERECVRCLYEPVASLRSDGTTRRSMSIVGAELLVEPPAGALTRKPNVDHHKRTPTKTQRPRAHTVPPKDPAPQPTNAEVVASAMAAAADPDALAQLVAHYLLLETVRRATEPEPVADEAVVAELTGQVEALTAQTEQMRVALEAAERQQRSSLSSVERITRDRDLFRSDRDRVQETVEKMAKQRDAALHDRDSAHGELRQRDQMIRQLEGQVAQLPDLAERIVELEAELAVVRHTRKIPRQVAEALATIAGEVQEAGR